MSLKGTLDVSEPFLTAAPEIAPARPSRRPLMLDLLYTIYSMSMNASSTFYYGVFRSLLWHAGGIEFCFYGREHFFDRQARAHPIDWPEILLLLLRVSGASTAFWRHQFLFSWQRKVILARPDGSGNLYTPLLDVNGSFYSFLLLRISVPSTALWGCQILLSRQRKSGTLSWLSASVQHQLNVGKDCPCFSPTSVQHPPHPGILILSDMPNSCHHHSCHQ